MSIKGTFTWAKNVKPEYVWFNGTASHYLLGEPFEPSRPLVLNPLYGAYDEPEAKIVPVKVHRAKQIYDTKNRTLIQPKLFSATPGDGGYWGGVRLEQGGGRRDEGGRPPLQRLATASPRPR